MKYGIGLFLVVSVMGCSGSHILVREHQADKVRPLAELTQSADAACSRDCVAYIEAGQVIPLRLSIDSDWLKVGQESVTLVAKKRIYFWLAFPEDASPERIQALFRLGADQIARMSDEERAKALAGITLYLSPDGVHWASPGDNSGLKQLFDIQGGGISLGMGMNQTDGVWISLALQILGGQKAGKP